jgi:hypothetical protein
MMMMMMIIIIIIIITTTISIYDLNFEKNILNIKCVFLSSYEASPLV